MNDRLEIAASLREIFADHQMAAFVVRFEKSGALGAGITLLRAVVGIVPPGQRERSAAATPSRARRGD